MNAPEVRGKSPSRAVAIAEPHHSLTLTSALQWLLSVVAIACFVMTFIVQAFEIPSESMENTLLIGDYLLVDKVQFSGSNGWEFLLPYRKIHRGDIIVFRYPVHPQQHFVKRVIGVPGDRVRIIDKRVYVDGVPQGEPYTIHTRDHDPFRDEFPTSRYYSGQVDSKWWLQMRKLTENAELIVPLDHYFVLGDNRDDSYDSRYWGFVPAENIVGRPLLIYFSVQRDTEDPDDNPRSDAKLNLLLQRFRWQRSHIRWDRSMKVVR